MKKIRVFIIAVSIMALTAVFAFTHTFSDEDQLLMENMEALAENFPAVDDEDTSSEDPGEGGGGSGVTLICTVRPGPVCTYKHSCGQEIKAANDVEGYCHGASGYCKKCKKNF